MNELLFNVGDPVQDAVSGERDAGGPGLIEAEWVRVAMDCLEERTYKAEELKAGFTLREDRYHIASRQTHTVQKTILMPQRDLEEATCYLKLLVSIPAKTWIQTGAVWPCKENGDQICVECDLWADEPHLVPMEVVIEPYATLSLEEAARKREARRRRGCLRYRSLQCKKHPVVQRLSAATEEYAAAPTASKETS